MTYKVGIHTVGERSLEEVARREMATMLSKEKAIENRKDGEVAAKDGEDTANDGEETAKDGEETGDKTVDGNEASSSSDDSSSSDSISENTRKY